MIMKGEYTLGEVEILYDRMLKCGLIKEPTIAVLGIGGAGCNIVEEMKKDIDNVKYYCLNSDDLSNLRRSGIDSITIGQKILAGHKDTSGFPEIGKRIIKEEFHSIFKSIIEPNDYFVIISGMGGTSAYSTLELSYRLNSSELGFSVYLIKPFEFEDTRKVLFSEVLDKLRKLRCPVSIFENDSMTDTVDGLNDKFAQEVYTYVKAKIKNLRSNQILAFQEFVKRSLPQTKEIEQTEEVPMEVLVEETTEIIADIDKAI